MTSRRFTLVDESRPLGVQASVHADTVRVSAAVVEGHLGWHVAPEGLCRGDTCVPVRDRAALVHGDGIDVAALARVLGRPFVMDADAGIGVLGAAAAERADRLASTEAPDFTLPDLTGRLHSLRDQRGKKTLLVAWASW
jgi:hypothetical protein